MSHTLLLADPSAAIRRVVEMTFADTGVEVLSVSDGEQAIQCISEKQPDIVLADIGMPKRSGYDVCAWVKAQDDHRQVPVLLLAGAFEPVDDDRARTAGCNGVLVKPFEPQHVIARVQELLGGVVGEPTRATADVPRPAARLTPPRPVELPVRDARHEVPDDLVDIDAADFGVLPDGAESVPPRAPAGLVSDAGQGGDVLDDYFDRLDEAVASVGDRPGALLSDAAPPAGPRQVWPVEPAAPPRRAPLVAEANDDDFDDGDLPTLEELLDRDEEAAGGPTVAADDDGDEAGGVPTLEELLGVDDAADEATSEAPAGQASAPPVPPDVEPGDRESRPQPGSKAEPAPPARAAAPPPAPAAPATPPIEAAAADEASRMIPEAFSAVLSGDAGGPPAPAAAPAAVVVDDETLDDLVRRVTERLAAAHDAAIEQAVARAVQAAVEAAVRAAVDAAAAPAVRQAVERAASGAGDRIARETTAAVEAALPRVIEQVTAEVTRVARTEVGAVAPDVVADVAERLVRDEIARIRDQA